jgi:pyruvate ferredoxin oxidoreductase beta subunit
MILGLPEKEYFASGHSACSGCGMALAFRHILKAVGDDAIVVMGTGCGEVISTPYPSTSWRHAAIHNAFETAASTASGVEAALKVLGKKTKVVAIAGDGGTFDIGFGAISGMIERGHNICYVCYDNAAYMNTGVQRSGATPKYTKTTTTPIGQVVKGKPQWRKPLPMIIASHNLPYVATASIAYPLDLYNKVKKGIETKGPTYIQIFSPCVPGWEIHENETVKIGELAVQTCAYPLFEIERGILNLKVIGNKAKLDGYFALQGRFKHLLEKENRELLGEIQKKTDEEWKWLLEKNGQRIC